MPRASRHESERNCQGRSLRLPPSQHNKLVQPPPKHARVLLTFGKVHQEERVSLPASDRFVIHPIERGSIDLACHRVCNVVLLRLVFRAKERPSSTCIGCEPPC